MPDRHITFERPCPRCGEFGGPYVFGVHSQDEEADHLCIACCLRRADSAEPHGIFTVPLFWNHDPCLTLNLELVEFPIHPLPSNPDCVITALDLNYKPNHLRAP